MSTEDDADADHHTALCFDRLSAGWRLVVRSGPNDDEAPEDTTPIANCPRYMRKRAADRLQNLLEELLRRAQVENNELAEAAFKAKQVLVVASAIPKAAIDTFDDDVGPSEEGS
ncbi:MAG: hypothetical protein ACRELY_17015 [Polyangiaceae bacterium]